MNERKDRILKLLIDRFSPESLSLSDDSHKHAGHHGHDGSPGTHFTLKMVSSEFDDVPRVGRQRLVYDCLEPEFETGLHAIVLKLTSLKEHIS